MKDKQWAMRLPATFALILILLVNGYPFLNTITASFTNWDGMFSRDFIGLKNYIELFSDDRFWYLLRNTLLVLLYLPISMGISLPIACMLKDFRKLKQLFLYVTYIPQIISTIIVGKAFNAIFGFDGPVNEMLGWFGIAPIDFLGKSDSAMLITILLVVWYEIGWQVLNILGSLSDVDSNISDVLEIDGVGFWRGVFCIYLPMIYSKFVYMGFVSLFFAFTGLFPIIYILTKGGPGYATTTIDYMVYNLAFGTSGELGKASALATLLLAVTVFAVVLYLVSMLFISRFLRFFYTSKYPRKNNDIEQGPNNAYHEIEIH